MMGTPRLLMLDEPSSGLDADDTARLSRILGETRRQDRAWRWCWSSTTWPWSSRPSTAWWCSTSGRCWPPAPVDEVLADPEVRRAYLGSDGVTSGPRPGPGADPLLELRGVGAAYGPYEALFDVSLTVRPGRALALVGANGAGKSTVARVVSGLVPTTRGTIRFDGRDITGRPAYEIARLGLSQLTEGRSVFASLTVEENLALPFRRALGRKGVPDALARAYEAFPRLGERRGQSAGTLSGGEQRMLALARVLVLHQNLLVVDELSFGLAPGGGRRGLRRARTGPGHRARRSCSSSSTSTGPSCWPTTSSCSARGASSTTGLSPGWMTA